MRTVIGVVAPATNVMVQPEMDALRPPGVVNAHARIANANQAVLRDADTLAVRRAMLDGLMEAVDQLAAVGVAHLVLGVMVENFADQAAGGGAGRALVAEAGRRAGGVGVSDYTTAIAATLAARFPGRPARIGLLTPFMPVGDAAARVLFEGIGHEVVRAIGLAAPSPRAIADLPAERILQALDALDGPDVDCLVQVGTNMDFAALAAEEEARRGKPVLASNVVLYRHALAALGLAPLLPP